MNKDYIEEVGWEFINSEVDGLYINYTYPTKRPKICNLEFRTDGCGHQNIRISMYNGRYTLFHGKLNTKEELEKLMVQLDIN